VLTIADEGRLTKVLVRAPHDGAVAAALGVRFGRAARDPHGALVVGSGPGEWLVIGPADVRSELVGRLEQLSRRPDEFASVVDLTHGRALLRLRGGRAADLLATLCAIDLSDDVTPNGAALRTSVAKLVTDLVRDDADGVPGYLLHCERSSGRYLFEALLDAAEGFGVELDTEIEVRTT
jgi:heterotetrameric sarcosine oxidase gamma subunit